MSRAIEAPAIDDTQWSFVRAMRLLILADAGIDKKRRPRWANVPAAYRLAYAAAAVAARKAFAETLRAAMATIDGHPGGEVN